MKQHRFLDAASFSPFQFLIHPHTDLDSLDKPGALMAAAEGADGVDNGIHLLQSHAVHGVIECLEVCSDQLRVHAIEFVVDLVQQTQWAVTIAEIGLLCTDVLAQEGEELGCFSSFEFVHVGISPCF